MISLIEQDHQRFRQIVRTPRKQVAWAAPTFSKIYVNNNRLLTTYKGANGVKTGYTHKAGPCLVASATRGGVSLLAVVLDSPDMYADAKRLLSRKSGKAAESLAPLLTGVQSAADLIDWANVVIVARRVAAALRPAREGTG